MGGGEASGVARRGSPRTLLLNKPGAPCNLQSMFGLLIVVAVMLPLAAVSALVLRYQCFGFNCGWGWLRHRLVILHAESRKEAPGTLLPWIGEDELRAATAWRSWLIANNQEDKDWDWRQFLQEFSLTTFLGRKYEAYALIVGEDLKALMILRTQGWPSRFPGDSSLLVYLEYVSVAPDCRRESSPRKYRYGGLAMLQFAIHRSRTLGLQGRVGLHSLPGAEDFYRSAKLHDFGPDAAENGYHYFESPRERV